MSVFGAKLGTKTWSDVHQNDIVKSEGLKTNSAQDLQKMGDQDIGDVLNRISDPNYVDPRKKVRAVGSDKMDKDAFMKLMLAQLKNQDPSNPLKSHEMAAQLAQFTGVEQMQNINTTLTEMQKGQKPMESYQALNLIGKSVSGDAAKIIRMKGDKDHDFSYNLPDDAKELSIKVRNSAGDIVRKIDLANLKKGDNNWVWNGKVENGTTAPVGEYQLVVEAKNSQDKKIAVKTDFDGVISGISYSAEGPVLMVGSQTIKMKDVRKIIDSGYQKKEQKPVPAVVDGQTQLDPKAQLAKMAATQASVKSAEKNEDKGADDLPPSGGDMLSNVAMSGGMFDKLKREVSTQAQQQESLEKKDVGQLAGQAVAQQAEQAPPQMQPPLHPAKPMQPSSSEKR